MKPLPQGKSLGWMQAPASWITTHTLRFIGVVRVVIKGREGFILIKKGKPLFYYFKQGTIELKGKTALDYFNSHPLIDFNLCKYNRDEFAWALNLCNIEDHEPVVSNVSVPVSRQPSVSFRPADPSIARPVDDKRITEPDLVYPKVQRIERTVVSEPVSRQPTLPSCSADPPVVKPVGDTRITEPDLVYQKEQRIENRATVSKPVSGQPTLSSRPADPPIAKPAGDKRITEPDLVYPKDQRIENRTAVSEPVSRQPTLPSRPADPPIAKPAGDKRIPEPDLVYPKEQRIENTTTVSEPISRQPTLPYRPANPPVTKPAGDERIPEPDLVSPRVHTLYKRAVVPHHADGDDTDITILSQIREIEGIVAISVFNDTRIVITVGDTDSEALLKIARTMLETAKKITPRPTWGPFVHMTIELPAGNMIIAPYRDNYLCLLTTRTINIGHIRRILRDLQRKSATQCVI
jgi:hypothetical protein